MLPAYRAADSDSADEISENLSHPEAINSSTETSSSIAIKISPRPFVSDLFNKQQIDISGLINEEENHQQEQRKVLSSRKKYISVALGFVFTGVFAVPAAVQYGYGLREFLEYINIHTDTDCKLFSASQCVIHLATASCYVATVCLSAENVIPVIQMLLNGWPTIRHNKWTLMAAYTLGIPLSAMVALASSGLSYVGSKNILKYYINCFSKKPASVDKITLASFGIATMDIPLTFLTEGRQTINSLKELFAALYLPSCASVSTNIVKLPYTIKKGCKQFFHTGSIVSLGKKASIVFLVGVLPVGLSLIGATAVGSQFYFGTTEINTLIKDLFASEYKAVQYVIHFVLRSEQSAIKFFSYLPLPIATATTISSFCLNGNNLISGVINVEKRLSRIAHSALYEVRYFSNWSFYQCSHQDEVLELYQGWFSELQRPSCNDAVNFVATQLVFMPLRALILCYALASACLTFTSMQENFEPFNENHSKLWLLSGLVAMVDCLQSMATEGGAVNTFGQKICNGLKWLIAKIAQQCCCEGFISIDFVDKDETEDESKEPGMIEVLSEGMRYFLNDTPQEATINPVLHRGGNTRHLWFNSSNRRTSGSVNVEHEQELALMPAISYDNDRGYGSFVFNK